MTGWSPDQITKAPSVICDQRRTRRAASPAAPARAARDGDTRRGPAVARIASVTSTRADAMREVNRDAGVPRRRQHVPEREREVGDRHARARCAASSRREESGSRSATVVVERDAPQHRDRRPRSARLPPAGDVKSARLTVMQKKICASPAWPIEIGAGRRNSTVMPPSRPCRMTAPSAMTPSRRTQRRGSDHPGPHGKDDRQEADRARDHAVAVLVEDAADHLLQREREHELAVGVRPVRAPRGPSRCS